MNAEKKIYTKEEIKKIAPGYRGKPEKFDPNKKGKRQAPKQQVRGPATKEVTPPTALDKAANPTPQKNTPLWADSIFGIDVAVRELETNQEITPSFARMTDIVEEVYSSIGGDDQNLNKQVTKGMLSYYSTALLWGRLLNIKAKRGNANLSFHEQEFCKAVHQHEYNVPQPLYLFLRGIGSVKDTTGKTMYLADHRLPTTVVQGMGGYHSNAVNAATHTLYEEIPSLGVCGDYLMAEASEAAQPVPNFGVLPPNTRATRNFCGNLGPVGARKEEVRIALNDLGITANRFDEVIAGTRLNIRLIQRVSDYFMGCPTFRNERVKLDALTVEGDAAQLIKTVPTNENVNPDARWTSLIIRPKSANANTVTTFGATYLMGYQLWKEPVGDQTTPIGAQFISTPNANEIELEMNAEKKIYTKEEIKKIAPGYRGKPEKFDPNKKGKRQAPKQQVRGPATKEVTPPTALDKAANPTPQKNTPLWADSIFGIDVAVRELETNQEITPSFARMTDIVEEVYSSIGGDDQNLNKQVTKGMLSYYSTALLWGRLLNIKAKRGNANLSFHEQEFCKAVHQHEYNVPQPLYLFLRGIGSVKDTTGKTMYLADHRLPTTVVQGMGGYHSNAVNAATHTLYEEIPSLGVCGDYLMAEASEAAQPVPNFGVLPPNTRATRNFCGNLGPVGARKEEVRIALNDLGITANRFDEVIAGTRLNIRLIQRVSDYFMGCPTFRNERVKLDALTVEGDAAQLIKTVPTNENVNPDARWTSLIIRPKSANANTVTTFGATYLMGYQLWKEPVGDQTTPIE
ncbi:hypothetical protein ACJJTC_016515 [Scirpophaga incertulas]